MLMWVDFTTLRLFLSAVRLGSIAKAADAENIAASAVSKRISELEARLKIPLLQRVPSGVQPTEAAMVMVRHAENIMSTLERMHMELSEYSDGLRGEVKVHANSISIAYALSRDIIAFSTQFPNLNVHLTEEDSEVIVRNVRDGVADLGVISANVEHGDLTVVPYQTIDLMLVVPKDHLLASKTSISFGETAHCQFVNLSKDHWINQLAITGELTKETRPTIRATANSYESLRHMIAIGLGIGILPQTHCVAYEAIEPIKCIHIEDMWSRLNLNLCWKHTDRLSRAAKLLVKNLENADFSAL